MATAWALGPLPLTLGYPIKVGTVVGMLLMWIAHAGAASFPARQMAGMPEATLGEPVNIPTGKPVSLHLKLASSLKLNEQASTWLALFRVEDKTRVAEWGRAALSQGKAKIPPLSEGIYRLQGRLYYCRKEKASLCWVRPWNQTVRAVNGKGTQRLVIAIEE